MNLTEARRRELILQLLELWRMLQGRGKGMKEGTHRWECPLGARQTPLISPLADRMVIPHLGGKHWQKQRHWIKGRGSLGKRTSNVCLFIPQVSLGVLDGQHSSPPDSFSPSAFHLKSTTEGSQPLHMALSFPVIMSSENIPDRSGFMLPPKDLQELTLHTTSWNITVIAPAGDVYNKNWMLQHELHAYLSSWFIHQK